MGGFSADGNIGVPEDVLGGLKFWTVDKFTLLNVSTHLTFQGKRMKKLSELEELRVLENYKSDCGFLDCSASRPRGLLPADQWLPANLYRLPKLKVLLGLPLTCMELLECPVLEWLELGKHCSCIPVEEHDPVGFLQRSSVDLAKIQRLVLSRLGNRSSRFLEEMLPRLSRIGHLDVSESIGQFREPEGITLILPQATADRLQLPYTYEAAWITLTVHSSLEAVGLTAAFAQALAAAQVSCNVVAAYYHDHLFVAARDADKAMQVLQRLAATAN